MLLKYFLEVPHIPLFLHLIEQPEKLEFQKTNPNLTIDTTYNSKCYHTKRNSYKIFPEQINIIESDEIIRC